MRTVAAVKYLGEKGVSLWGNILVQTKSMKELKNWG